MYKVEIKRVTNLKNNKQEFSIIETFYFNGETAFEDAKRFTREFNRNMPFYEDGYTIAARPIGCHSYLLQEVLIEALATLRNTIRRTDTNKTHKLGEYVISET